MLPMGYDEKYAELRNWDFWGPLFFCLVITFFMALSSSSTDSEAIFGSIYMLLFGGALVIGVNSYLVGTEGSIFMMISVLGYSLAPFAIAAVVNYFFRRFLMLIGMMGVCAFAWFWSVKSAAVFIASCARKTRRMLVLYPIMLYYMFFAFFIALND